MRLAALALTFALCAGAAAAEPAATPVMSATETNAGQPIVLPQGPVEVRVSKVSIPAGERLPVHKHPYPRYGVVETGRIRVIYPDLGKADEFGPGGVIIEALETWHTGEALEDVVLLVIDQAPPGEGNVDLKD